MKKLNYFKVYGGLPREVYIFFIAKVITCMGAFILPLWTLILTQKIGLSVPQAGLMSTLYAVSQGPCLLIGGKLIDAIGRKKVIFFCHTMGSLFYIVCACIPMNMLTAVFIMIASDFYTVTSPAIDALMADVTTPECRKASFSLIYFGLNLGYTFSPLLGGLLFEHYLPVLFVLDAVTTMISSCLIMLKVKESRHDRNVESMLGDQLHTEKTPVLKVLFRLRILLYFLLVMTIYDFCYTQWSFMLPLQMANIYVGNGAKYFSYLVAMNSFTVIVFTPLVTSLSHRYRSLTIAAVGGLCFFAAFITFGIVAHLPLFLTAAFILTIGEILITVNINTFIADQSPSTHRGRINSVGTFLQGGSRALSPLIMGNLIVVAGYSTSWWIIAALMLTGVLCMFALDKKNSRQAKFQRTSTRII